MAEGIPNPNVILKIGFLNKNTEENLIKYKVPGTVGADGWFSGGLTHGGGITNPIVILKIGFLNKNTEKNLIKYKVHADGWLPGGLAHGGGDPQPQHHPQDRVP
jgi:hypothetical protein